jgi:hypothetical protein
MRYSDALMMKAEAIARGGAGTNDVAKLTALQDQVRWERFLLH